MARFARVLVRVLLLTLRMLHSLPDVVVEEETIKIRMFWIRHGLSCANVLDACAVKPPSSNILLPEVQQALASYPHGNLKVATLNETFGVAAATSSERDCTVEMVGPGLIPGQMGEHGAIVRIHDLYRDPSLTDCSRLQSVQAGRAFLTWLKASNLRLDFVGSSFLMRAFETACGMFEAPCSGDDNVNCSDILASNIMVTPVPYITERAPHGMTAAQADNAPRDVDEQIQRIERLYGRKLNVDNSYAKTWPRDAQQYEKFKAFMALQILSRFWKSEAESISTMKLQEALEDALPASMHHEDHGKQRIRFQWENGVYETGPEFLRAEYHGLDVREVNIAIVGHNQMMMEYCQKGQPPKPNNNAILEKLFILRRSSLNTERGAVKFNLRELGENCAVVMDAPDSKSEGLMRQLYEADVASCTDPVRVPSFLGLLGKGHLPDTPCAKSAFAPNAYPIQSRFFVGRSEL